PGLKNGIDPAPSCFDLVAAHEQSCITANNVHEQPLIGLGRVNAENIGEVHVEWRMLQPHSSGPGLLQHEPELDAFVGLQPYDEPGAPNTPRFRWEYRMRDFAKSNRDFRNPPRQALTCAQIKGGS